MNVADQRRELVEMLCEASELEHGVCLQYLFAAFSLKVRPEEPGMDELTIEQIREWKADLLLIAREEMLHLALVTNMLAAFGAGPYLNRPRFPQPAHYFPLGVISSLEPFSLQALERFLVYEQPAPTRHDGVTVGELYGRIRDIVTSVDEDRLFIGSALRQIDASSVLDPLALFDDDVRTGYGVEPFAVTGRESALAAIELIVEQGEGCGDADANSHYARLLRMRGQLVSVQRERPAFAPARPVISNPVVAGPADAGARQITHPLGREAAILFNGAYRLMILMLLRFNARTDSSPEEVVELQRIVFFPLMTMVIRPLGEILTELPALADEPSVTAGATFEFGRDLGLIPEPRVARQVFGESLDEIAQHGRRLVDLLEHADFEPRLRDRTAFLSENLDRLASSFSVRRAALPPDVELGDTEVGVAEP
jgi:hypothetical protein